MTTVAMETLLRRHRAAFANDSGDLGSRHTKDFKNCI